MHTARDDRQNSPCPQAATPLPPRERIEAAIEALIDLLDFADAPAEDLEPETDLDVEEVNAHLSGGLDWRGGAGDPDDAESDDVHDGDWVDQEFNRPEQRAATTHRQRAARRGAGA